MPIYNAPLKNIDVKETRRYAGLSIADFDERLIDDACEEMLYLAQPRGSWEIYEYDNKSGTVKANTPFIIEGSKILKHLSHSEKVVILAVTVGDVGKIIDDSFKKGGYVHGMLLDAAATTAVEQTADNLEDRKSVV